jgi:hypothetical protein
MGKIDLDRSNQRGGPDGVSYKVLFKQASDFDIAKMASGGWVYGNPAVVVKPDGGPAKYYDLPPKAVTLNDILEVKGDTQWLGDTFHLANIVKAAWRWGDKEGTSKDYDARKFIYSGARLLMKLKGATELRRTLQQMLDDPQFGER